MALGLNVQEPAEVCDDGNCPFHGTLSVRGQTIVVAYLRWFLYVQS